MDQEEVTGAVLRAPLNAGPETGTGVVVAGDARERIAVFAVDANLGVVVRACRVAGLGPQRASVADQLVPDTAARPVTRSAERRNVRGR